MLPPQIIALDMDGTLLGPDGRISPRNRSALLLAQSTGAEIVIATGRRHAYAMRVLQELGLRRSSALVSSNGTVLRTLDSQLLHRAHLPAATARRLCTQLADFRSSIVLTFDNVGPDGNDSFGALVCEHLDELHASIGRWMQTNLAAIACVPRLEDALHATPPIQMMVAGPLDRMAEAEARLAEDPLVTPVNTPERPGAEVALHRTIYPDQNLCIVDILPAGCSKGSALRHLAHLRGLSTDSILAIGDNWNDLPMLQIAGRAALMANAPAELQALAHTHGWQLAPSNAEDGVAAIIEAVLEPTLAWSGS